MQIADKEVMPMSRKMVLSMFLLAAFMSSFFINSNAETIHNPVVEADDSMDAKQKVTWDCVYFGSYPQTEIIGTEQYNNLDGSILAERDYAVEPEIYQALQQASESVWDNNGDITLTKDGQKYRRMKQSEVLSRSTTGNPMYYKWEEEDIYHYFRYDPIKWRVLSTDGSSVLLLADKVLDYQYYHNDNAYVFWSNSSLRSFLNGYGPEMNKSNTDYSAGNKNFIDCAFSPDEKDRILVTGLENIDISTNKDYSDVNIKTEDQIFVVSDSEISSENSVAYGFVANFSSPDEGRKCRSTTYAKAMGLQSQLESAVCEWWLRTGRIVGSTSDKYSVDTLGKVEKYAGYVRSFRGIRPALRLPVSSLNYAGTVESSDYKCNHEWSDWVDSDDYNWETDHDSCRCGYQKIPYTRTCSRCSKKEVKEVTKYFEHDWGEWYVTEKATPFQTGIKERKCKCGLGQTICSCREKKVISKRKMTANEKKAYNVTKNFFKYAKTYNIKKMNACFASSQPASFFKDNKYMASYCRKYNKKKLKISPVDIVVKGKKATVTLKVTYPNAYKPLLKTCEAMNWNGYSYHNKKGKAKMKAFVKRYTKAYGVGKQTKTIKVNLKKTKKKGWKLSSPTTALKNAINCNYRTAFKDAK